MSVLSKGHGDLTNQDLMWNTQGIRRNPGRPKQPGRENSYINCTMRKSHLSAVPYVVPIPKIIEEPLSVSYALQGRDNWQWSLKS